MAAARQAFQRGAYAQVTTLLAGQPQTPDVLELLGMAWGVQRHWEQALSCQQALVKLVPEQSAAWINLAITQTKLEQLDAALNSLARAESIDAAQPAVYINRGNVQAKRGAWQDALASFERALQLAPGEPDPQVYRAIALRELKRLPEAKMALETVLARHPQHALAKNLLGSVLHRQREDAQTPLEHASPDDPFGLNALYHVEADCDWDQVDRCLAGLRTLWAQGGDAELTPMSLLFLPLSRQELKQFTEVCAEAELPSARPWPAGQGRNVKQRPARLRIGYFSADFHQHATSFLMAGMLEAHDKSRFETVGFCFGRYGDMPDDEMRQRVRAAFDRFEIVGELDTPAIVTKARSLGIDIAVDLKGHTQDSRLDIFSLRAAPIQMHYLGYPGTLGMLGAIDYLVADSVLVPREMRVDYSEKIIALPDCYQVNDRQRTIASHKPSRIELGLPVNGFVFCCFNKSNKITRDVFQLWLELLRARPGSVLWLREENSTADANLRAAATAAGIDASRLVFAQRMPLPEHLARHAQADLFLDTLYYSAHTTASDALWTGLPVVTCIGQTFASRVAASLLTACRMPELITHSHREYLDLALALSADPARLQALRQRLENTRLQVPLFDTERFTRHIERAYDLAWDRFERGLPPDHIVVPSIDECPELKPVP